LTPARPWWREPTSRQWSCYLAAWAGWVLDAFDFTVYLLVAAEIADEFGATLTAVNGVVTATLLARLLGGTAAGAAADRWGRRPVLAGSIVMMALCDGAIAFAPSLGWVLLLRVVFGFAMGAEWTAGATMAMENWPARSRGIASGILQGSWAVGYFLAAVVSRWVVPAWGWRGLFLLAAAPALLVVPLRLWVREEPRPSPARAAAPASWRVLAGAELRPRLLWATLVLLLGFGVYYALVASYPAMLRRELGLAAPAAGAVVAWFNAGMLAGAALVGPAFARFGARLALGVPALLTIPLLPLYLGRAPSLLVPGAFLMGAAGAGSSGATPLLMARLFPAAVRARAAGFVYHAGALMAAAAPPLVAWLAEGPAGMTLAGAMAAVVIVLQTLLAGMLLLAPVPAQARGARTLERPAVLEAS
jgi:SHS family lactate transporter-like MFS transporter